MPVSTEEWKKDKAIDGKYAVIIERSGRDYGARVKGRRNSKMNECWWYTENELTFVAPGNRESLHDHCAKMFKLVEEDK